MREMIATAGAVNCILFVIEECEGEAALNEAEGKWADWPELNPKY